MAGRDGQQELSLEQMLIVPLVNSFILTAHADRLHGFQNSVAVGPELGRRLLVTLELAGLACLTAIPLGVWAALRRVCRDRMALIPQDALQSLNPSLRTGFQIGEPMTLHGRIPQGGTIAHVMPKISHLIITKSRQSC
ncbi:MAG: hypothetical protein Q4G26_03650 [Paracoccus sp. (in: a-proteobacteria)]|nr:hypothetical protein [Paracoccus sp. (in: a-proteobacteria)]